MSQQCHSCSRSFEARAIDQSYYDKFGLGAPNFCPDCRLRQRQLFRNERALYRRNSSKSGKAVISIYHPDSPLVVYSTQEWWADDWDATDYGRDIDFTRPFFDQFKELQSVVPRISLFNVNPDNSEYCQQAYDNKNCYLCSVVKDCWDCMYVTHSNNLRDCFDSSHLQNCELVFDSLDSDKLYNCIGCSSCQNSSDCYFCTDCIGCTNCIGCAGLRNKKFCIENKQVTEEEFNKFLATLNLGSRDSYEKARQDFEGKLTAYPHRENRNLNVENCLGNYLINSRNSYECFDAFEIEDCAYSTWIFESKDCYDIYGMGTSELVYSSVGVEKLNFAAFCTFVSHSSNVFYSDLCFHSKNLFGCIGLKNKEYSILNKEYSKDDYEKLSSKLISHMKETGEWGQFFPATLSPFSYNESVACDYFPLTKGEVTDLGYRWRDADKKDYKAQTATLPDSISEVQPAITNEVLACKSCKKNYKLMLPEIQFYKKLGLPAPAVCQDCRYTERSWRRTPRQLWNRTCNSCQAQIQSPYAPQRPEKVVCESCYRLAVG